MCVCVCGRLCRGTAVRPAGHTDVFASLSSPLSIRIASCCLLASLTHSLTNSLFQPAQSSSERKQPRWTQPCLPCVSQALPLELALSKAIGWISVCGGVFVSPPKSVRLFGACVCLCQCCRLEFTGSAAAAAR